MDLTDEWLTYPGEDLARRRILGHRIDAIEQALRLALRPALGRGPRGAAGAVDIGVEGSGGGVTGASGARPSR